MTDNLFIFGFGETAAHIATILANSHWQLAGTSRNADKRWYWHQQGVELVDYQAEHISPLLNRASHVLITLPPDPELEPDFTHNLAELVSSQAPCLEWLGYVSTTGVYGNHDGQWVTEASPLYGDIPRLKLRQDTEAFWQDFGDRHNLATFIFRPGGIYGPNRNALSAVKANTARSIIQPSPFFSRIHIHDLAGAIVHALDQPDNAGIYNICDNRPAPTYEINEYAAELLNQPAPPRTPFAEASLSPMAQSFFQSSRRVSNERLKKQLGYQLIYPSYKEGLQALLENSTFTPS